MSWSWLIIIGVLLLALGPVLYLLPNAKDKRLSALREAARKLGLIVKISFVPQLDPTASERVNSAGKDLEPKQTCHAYQMAVGTRLELEQFLLLRIPLEPTRPVNEVVPGWSLDSAYDRRGLRELFANDVLPQTLSNLPEDVIGLGFDGRFIAAYWLEGPGHDAASVQLIHDELAHLRNVLSEVFTPRRDLE